MDIDGIIARFRKYIDTTDTARINDTDVCEYLTMAQDELIAQKISDVKALSGEQYLQKTTQLMNELSALMFYDVHYNVPSVVPLPTTLMLSKFNTPKNKVEITDTDLSWLDGDNEFLGGSMVFTVSMNNDRTFPMYPLRQNLMTKYLMSKYRSPEFTINNTCYFTLETKKLKLYFPMDMPKIIEFWYMKYPGIISLTHPENVILPSHLHGRIALNAAIIYLISIDNAEKAKILLELDMEK